MKHDIIAKINKDLFEIDKLYRLKSNFLLHYDKKKISFENIFSKYFMKNFRKYVSHHHLHSYSLIDFINKNNIDCDEELYILINDGLGSDTNDNNEFICQCISLFYYNFKSKKLENIFSYFQSGETNLMKNFSPSAIYGLICAYYLNFSFGEEGKVLALESKVKEYNSTEKIEKVNKLTNLLLKIFIKNFHKNLTLNSKIKKCLIYNNVEKIKDFFQNVVIDKKFKQKIFDNNYIVAYALQTFYEKIILYIVNYSVKKYNIKNLGYCGGGAFNVKLNNLILNSISGKLIINPVPGDGGLHFFKHKDDLIDGYKNRYLLEKKINKIKNDR
jgi:predicted NodU family carbamoyl transferase